MTLLHGASKDPSLHFLRHLKEINISVNIFSSYGIGPGRFNSAKSMNSRSAEIFPKILACVDRLSNILSIVDYKIPFDTIQV